MSKGSGFKSAIKNEIRQDKQLAEELHKTIVRKFEKRKVLHLLKIIFGVLI